VRILLLTFIVIASWGQPLPVQTIDSSPLRKALPPVEQWLGAPLVIFENTLLVSQPEPGEASISNHAIYVPLSRLRALRTPGEAAAFLSHAAAHNKLNHAELYSEKVQLFEKMAVLSPHFPQASMEANLRAKLETEAEAVAAEFLAKSGCTARRCDLFRQLLDAVK
jgi:hypothetical protein